LRRNLETANQRREQNKTAEENRQKSERLAREAARLVAENAKAAKEQAATAKEKGRPQQGAGRLSTVKTIADAYSMGGPPTLKKRYNPNRPLRAAEDNGDPPAEGTEEYLAQQIFILRSGQGLGAHSKQAFQRREQAVDNLKALGAAARPAVPALAWAATNDRDPYVKRRAIEVLGEIGGLLGIRAVGRTLLQPGNNLEITRRAEDSLLKLLAAVGDGLTMNDAIFLWEVHRLGNKRVSPAIERAWAASGITQDAIAREINKPALARQAARDQAIANAEAHEKTERKWKEFFAGLPPDLQARVNQAIANANGTEEQDRRFKECFMTLPPAWQKEAMKPKPGAPDFFDWFNKVNAMSAKADAEQRAAETRRRNAERALPNRQLP
jgi:hypothetical protein